MRVVVADDHPLYRSGLRMMLAEFGVQVVAEATTGEAAITAAVGHGPDVIVMDINMPVLNGIEATRSIVEKVPAARILILTMCSRTTIRSSPPCGPALSATSSRAPARRRS